MVIITPRGFVLSPLGTPDLSFPQITQFITRSITKVLRWASQMYVEDWKMERVLMRLKVNGNHLSNSIRRLIMKFKSKAGKNPLKEKNWSIKDKIFFDFLMRQTWQSRCTWIYCILYLVIWNPEWNFEPALDDGFLRSRCSVLPVCDRLSSGQIHPTLQLVQRNQVTGAIVVLFRGHTSRVSSTTSHITVWSILNQFFKK